MTPLRLLAGVLLLATTTPAQASPLQLFGLGASSPGRGGTGVADATGFECVYLNPAGLADAPGKRLTLGVVAGSFELDGVPRTIDRISGVVLGGALRLPLGAWLRDRVGLGFGFYVPQARLNKARAPSPGTPYYALLENRAETVGIQVGLGVRLTPAWSVGFSVLTLAALRGRIDVTTTPDGQFLTTSEQQLLGHYAPIAGVRWSPAATIEAGLVLRGESRSAYDLEVTSDLGDSLPLTLPQLRFAGVSQYDPLTVALEGAYRYSSWSFTGQLAYERWSAFPLPTQNPVMAMPAQELPGFSDVVVPRAGAVWRRPGEGELELELRGGYFFAWSPAPAATGPQAFLDNHRHVFSLGAGLAAPSWRVPFHVDGFFQLHALQPRTHDRPMDEPDVSTGGVILVGGLSLGVDL